MADSASEARTATLALLATRAPGATICPSEVARVLADADAPGEKTDWRAMIPTVHAAIDALLASGEVHLSWKGEVLPSRSGPYRINRGLAA